MLRNNYIRLVYALLFSGIILFLVFRPDPKYTVVEKKIGEPVSSKDFLLKVLDVKYIFGNMTRINLAVRNLTNQPIRFLVTDHPDKAEDLHYRKYFFVVKKGDKVYSTGYSNHIVEPGDDSGQYDRELEIYFFGEVTSSEDYFLVISNDFAGQNDLARVLLNNSINK